MLILWISECSLNVVRKLVRGLAPLTYYILVQKLDKNALKDILAEES